MVSTRHVFVVRIWIEQERSPTDGRQIAVLRGSLEHINQKDARYFTSLEEIVTLIEATLAWNYSTTDSLIDAD